MANSIIIPSPLDEVSPAGAPWWLKVIYTFGIPAAIALYLVYVISTTQAAAVASIKTTVESHATASLLSDAEVKASGLRVEAYMRLMCVNTAKTAVDRNTCLSVR